MKASCLSTVILSIAVITFGLSSAAQDRPSRAAVVSACARANLVITELIELAPFGTGWVNRTEAWLENLIGVAGDLLSWILDTQPEGELSQAGKAVIAVDVGHTFLHFDLRTIMNANGEAVDDIMPSKLLSPADYTARIKALREFVVDPECRRLLG